MQARYNELEVVRVTEGCKLVDARECSRTYWRRDGKPLAEGFYVVTWPEGATRIIFNDDAVFRGPFKQRDDAQSLAERIRDRRPDAHFASGAG